ncbi:MAG: hypothetical protein E7663_01350 [Ruminococcaceae bacterium]|nr:hypothetical protein [Oscillospiraceae bacterium]
MNTIKLCCKNKPFMIAHRGCSGLERENTAAAFVAAGNRTYFGIETDVHRTLDGKYIIIHDDDTKRVAIDKLTVEESTFDTLRGLTLLNKFSEQKDRADLVLPSLEEYIAICKKYEKKAVLELKNPFGEEDICAICRIIEEMDYLGEVIFISFCYENLVFLRKHYPKQPAQYLVSSFNDGLIDKLKAQSLDLDIHYKALSAERVALCHQNGIKVNTRGVDMTEASEMLASIGTRERVEHAHRRILRALLPLLSL